VGKIKVGKFEAGNIVRNVSGEKCKTGVKAQVQIVWENILQTTYSTFLPVVFTPCE
jgi:hypothetical protein